LRTLVGRDDVKNGIVFCNRKSEVDVVAKSLKKHGFDASPIHGDLEQSQRTRTLDAFRRGELKVLVASDVAARGLDIPDVSHIFNYDVPHHADDYVHRIGRTGRAGKTGQTYMIVTPADGRALDKVVRLTGKAPDEVKLDLDWSQAKTSPRSGGERRPDSSRGRRDRSRGRPASETSVAAMVPITPAPAQETEPVAAPVEPAPQKAQEPRRDRREPRREHGEPRSERSEGFGSVPAEVESSGPPEPRRERGSHASRSRPSDRRRDQPAEAAEDKGSRVVGFGADTPAFLARAMPTPASADD
jgi:superfamily II DNA/RNA helicase